MMSENLMCAVTAAAAGVIGIMGILILDYRKELREIKPTISLSSALKTGNVVAGQIIEIVELSFEGPFICFPDRDIEEYAYLSPYTRAEWGRPVYGKMFRVRTKDFTTFVYTASIRKLVK